MPSISQLPSIITSKTRAVGNIAPRNAQRVDTQAPISRGLVSAIYYPSGPRDLVQGLPAFDAWDTTRAHPFGVSGLAPTSTTVGRLLTADEKTNIPQKATLACWFRLNAVPGAGKEFCLATYGGQAVSTQYGGYNLRINENGRMHAMSGKAGTPGSPRRRSAVTADSVFAAGGNYLAVGTFSAGAATNVYVHGVIDPTNTPSGTGSSVNATAGTPYAGAWEQFSNANNEAADAVILNQTVWSRVLTDDEIWSLYDPQTRWDLYWQPRRTYFIPAAAGGGDFSGWWARPRSAILGQGFR